MPYIFIGLVVYSVVVTVCYLYMRRRCKEAEDWLGVFKKSYIKVCMKFGEYKHKKGDI